MNAVQKSLFELRFSPLWQEIEPILMQLNDISSEIDNEFYKDHRGIAKLIGCDDLCRDLEGCDNPIDRLVTHWIRKNDKATLLDLLNYILKIGRSDIYKSINVVLDNMSMSISQEIPKYDEENIITYDDVKCMGETNTYMEYDAYILFADDERDLKFAFEIQKVMKEKHGFKLCTKEDFLIGVTFEHDAIIRLLEQHRCDKLIIIISSKFFQDNLTRFITRYAQTLQIHDNRKIIPCTQGDFTHFPILYNLKGYSVLSIARSGRLFNFWKRLQETLEEGRVSRKQEVFEEHVSKFEIEKNDNDDKGIKSKAKKMCKIIKHQIKKVLVRE